MMTLRPRSNDAERPEIWSPRVLAIVTLLLGFTAGGVLAAIDWWRLGARARAVEHLALLVLAASLYSVAILLFPGVIGVALGYGVTVLAAIYLYVRMHADLHHAAEAGQTITPASWLAAGLAGAVVAIITIAIVSVHRLLLDGMALIP
ncbi:MAG: hypothetical protein IT305_26920 [Chloroflexi bacterium]|nr:hypothetical protein [Chloroflexota bacterium]